MGIMITRGFLDGFIKKFEYCKDLDFNWNTRLFEKTGSESWGNILIERSRDLRHSFEINEENIKALQEALSNPLSEKEYKLVADAALRMYQDGYDDIRIFPLMLEPCIEYFKSVGNLDYVIPLIHAYCFEFEQADLETLGSPKYAYEDILTYKSDYLSIDSRYARLTLWKSYSNVISRILNNEEVGSFSKMYSLYLEALSLWEKEEVQRLDGQDEEFLYFIKRMLQTVMLYENIAALTEEEKQIYEHLIEENKAGEDDDSQLMIGCIEQILLNYEGKIPNEEVVDFLLSSFDEVFSHLDLDEDPNEQEDYIDDCYNIIATLSSFMNGPRRVEEKQGEMIERMNRLRLFVKSLPYTFYNGEMNRYVYMLYQRIRPFMSLEEKKDYLLEVVMFRQPITCIHSLMVESISEAIGRYLLDHNPELFIGVMDCRNSEDVHAKRDEILKFIAESALYHDVGKITLVDIINTQNRRLTDVEFSKIKTHPDNGLTILANDPDFACFYDVIRGHHRYYDGSFGYPEGFDNTSSKLRTVIDIVTIADCTDAATDILGRNYAKGKTFRAVLDEFVAGAGTRYNPDIAYAIKNDEALIEELTRLTTEGRMDIYKEVYSRYIS